MGAAETIFVVQGELESVSHEILPGQRGSMDARIEQINIDQQKHFGIMPIPSARFGEIAPGWGQHGCTQNRLPCGEAGQVRGRTISTSIVRSCLSKRAAWKLIIRSSTQRRSIAYV